MIANIFNVKGLNIHLGYRAYSSIVDKCIKNGNFTSSELYSSEIISYVFYPAKSKKLKKKIYKAICARLEKIADENYDDFIAHYYNSSYYDNSAKENISNFLDGVSCVYKQLRFKPESEPVLRFPYGKKFQLCYKSSKRNMVEITIDTEDVEGFWGSVDYFYIHFKSGLVLLFNYGDLLIYTE